MSQRLEFFLFSYLSNFMDFLPDENLVKAIHDWVYEGKVPDDDFPKSWSTGRRFEEEAQKGLEYFMEHMCR